MQKALSLAVLLGSMVALQGCGGGDPTSAPPVATTTVAPTTTIAAVADVVITGAFQLDGLTKAQAETPAVKTAIEKGLADTMGVDASAVEITGFTEVSARRLMMGRRLSTSLKAEYKLTLPGNVGAEAQETAKAAVMTAATAVAADTATLVSNIKAAIAADTSIPAEIATAATSIAVPKDAIETPKVEETHDHDHGSNSTRRLSFSFVTSDEPLIL
jgi:hypothetical protein